MKHVTITWRHGSTASAPAWASRVGTRTVAFDGHRIWAAWHTRALSCPDGDDSAWISREVLPRLPCGDCRGHAIDYLKAHPVGTDYFAWTVAFHNAVNERLGKPSTTVDDARALWTAKPVL